MPINRSKSDEFLLPILGTVAVLLTIAQVTHSFNLKFTDVDQLAHADMASHFAEGHIPEPLFWGQNYLFPLESWFAAPLVRLGVRADYAILIPPAFMTLVLVYSALQKISHLGLRLMTLVLLMPLIYSPSSVISLFLPRNFTTLTATAGCLVLLSYSDRSKVRLATSFFVGLIVGTFEPLVVLVPLLLFRPQKKHNFVSNTTAVVVGFLAMRALSLFYVFHPNFVVYANKDRIYSIEILTTNLKNFEIIKEIAFVGFPSISLYVFLIIWSRKRKANDRALGYLLCAIFELAAILLMLSSSKLTDFVDSVFYSLFRFLIPFIFLPLLQVAHFSKYSGYVVISEEVRARKSVTHIRAPAHLAQILVVLILLLQTGVVAKDIANSADDYAHSNTPTGVIDRSILEKSCHEFSNQIDKGHEYVSVDYANDSYFAFGWIYGCRAISGVYVVARSGDRRTWLENWLHSAGFERRDIEALIVPDDGVL